MSDVIQESIERMVNAQSPEKINEIHQALMVANGDPALIAAVLYQLYTQPPQ